VTGAARGNAEILGVVVAVASALGFSTLALWGKFSQQLAIPTETFLAFRFGLAALALLPLTARGLTAKDRVRQTAFGSVYTVQTLLYFSALQQVSASVTTLLLYLAPGFVVLYEWLLGTQPQRTQLMGLALSSLGLVVIVGLPSPSNGTITGFVLAVLSGACYAGFLVASSRLFPKADSLTLTANASLGSSAGFVILGFFTTNLRLPTQALEWGTIFGAVVCATLLAIPLMFQAVKLLGATRSSLLFTLEPVFVTGLALVFLGEPLTLGKVIGGALILGGAMLAQGFSRSRA
jgi:drug/metabolite transporter (DMT)-like permease